MGILFSKLLHNLLGDLSHQILADIVCITGICTAGIAKSGAIAARKAGFVVYAEIGGVLALKAELAANLIQSLYLRLRKLLRAAKLVGYVKKPCIELNRLHLVISV